MKLSVIVPSYNEAQNFKTGRLMEMYAYLSSLDYDSEILLVDDGSTDQTLKLLRGFAKGRKRLRVIENPHQGKSLTVRTGMLAAKGEWRLFTDFDQSTPIMELDALWKVVPQGAEVVIGSRELEGSIRDQEPWYRHLMGRGFNLIVRLLTVKDIKDTQCGFKLFSQKAAEDLFRNLKITTNPSKVAFTGAFDVELLFLAQKRGYHIQEVPIHWRHHETQRVSPIRDSVKMFLQVVHIWITYITGGYDS